MMTNRQRMFTKRIWAVLTSTVMTVVSLMTLPLCSVTAPFVYVEEHNLEINGTETLIHTIDLEYDGNLYLPLREVASALKDTELCFEVDINGGEIRINTGGKYEFNGFDEDKPAWSEERIKNLRASQAVNKLYVDDNERKYYTILIKDSNEEYECFMSYVDLAMILDVSILIDDDMSIFFDTERTFSVDPYVLEEEGYFYGINGVLVGDCTTGRVFYSYNSSVDYPIASTTKLMTYLLTMEEISAGSLSMDTTLKVSALGEQLSQGGDGVIPVKEGQSIHVEQLLYGLMLPSANEFALTLAEGISGSEEAFVQRMNERADELGLKDTIFYTCNGLPTFINENVSSKVQNRMSVKDMFILCKYILENYPEIKTITSTKKYNVADADNIEIKNTNMMLYNLEEVTGLKTGTTNKAGACLVNTLEVDGHDLIVILFGAEDNVDRYRVTEVLSRYALNVWSLQNQTTSVGTVNSAEDVVRMILQNAM